MTLLEATSTSFYPVNAANACSIINFSSEISYILKSSSFYYKEISAKKYFLNA